MKKDKCLFETSTLRKNIWGTSDEIEDIKQIAQSADIYTSTYCIKEFLVGVILPLVSFYFILEDSRSSKEAVSKVSNIFSPRTKSLFIPVVHDISKIFNEDKDHDLITIITYIDNLLTKCKSSPIKSILNDNHNCVLSKIEPGYTKESLVSFYLEIKRLTGKKSECAKCKISRYISEKSSDIDRVVSSTNSKKENEYKRIKEVVSKTRKIINCKHCSSIGDLIISLENKYATIITYDKTQKQFCNEIGRNCILLTNKGSLSLNATLKKIGTQKQP